LHRLGDNGRLALLQLVDNKESPKKEAASSAAKKQPRSKAKKAVKAAGIADSAAARK
jgi:hypothetical protein